MNRLLNRKHRSSNNVKLSQLLLALLTIFSLLTAGLYGQGNAIASAANGTSTNGSSPDVAIRFPAYFIEWGVYDRDYLPADIPSDVTTINYAFIVPDVVQSGSVYTYSCKLVDTYGALQ